MSQILMILLIQFLLTFIEIAKYFIATWKDRNIHFAIRKFTFTLPVCENDVNEITTVHGMNSIFVSCFRYSEPIVKEHVIGATCYEIYWNYYQMRWQNAVSSAIWKLIVWACQRVRYFYHSKLNTKFSFNFEIDFCFTISGKVIKIWNF